MRVSASFRARVAVVTLLAAVLGTVATLGIMTGSAAAQNGVTVTASLTTVIEGLDARFVLVRTGATDTEATVDVSVTETGSMLAGGGGQSRTVTFEPNSASATLTLPTVDDTVVESDSEVTVTVGSSSATVTVEDDDTAEFALSVSPSGLSEAEADSVAVTVTITNGVTFAKPQDIDITLDGTAAAGVDFILTDVAARLVTKPFSLKLAAGESEAAGAVTAVDDTVDDDAETVVVTASHNGAGIGSAIIAITDDDDAAPALALAALSMSGNVGRAMYPAFDAETLHYAAGCSDADAATVDSLTLTMSTESSDTRLAVNGIQVPNSNALVPLSGLDGTSDIVIVLSNAAGQARTYTIHCLDHDYPTITVTKQPGAWDGLILGALPGADRGAVYRWSVLQIMDTNGVPWFRRRVGDFRVANFKPLQTASYAYGYIKVPGPDKLQMLDDNLEEAAPAMGPPSSADSDEGIDNHDFAARANDNIVMVTTDPTSRDLSAFTDDDGNPYSTNEAVRDQIIREVTPGRDNVFTWNTKDHMELVDCTQHRFTASEGAYAHFNSIEVVDGNLLVSFRGCAAVVMIDGSTGEVIWRLGRSNLSDDEWRAKGLKPPLKIVGDPYGEFCGQHSAKILGNGNLILYDNGVYCLEDPDTGATMRTNREFSRVVEYALDVGNGEAVFVRHHSYNDAFDAVTPTGGLVAPISNGNWLISWNPNATALPSITEWDPVTGTELLHVSHTDSAGGRGTWRAYPMRYDEFPAETAPLSAVFAESDFSDEAYTGMSDSPQVVVAFNRPVADLAADSPSVSVTGATVASVRAHVVPGEAANAYIFTLTPTGTDTITFSLVADAPCASRGVCTADGTVLSEVPAARELALDLPPTIDSATALDVPEATTAVATLAASDPDTSASQLVWSIPEGAAGGADADKFALSTAGVLTLLAAKDFEAPDDADGDGTYEVTVQVADTASQVTADLRVTLIDVNEAPVVSGPAVANHEENDPDAVESYTVTDPEDDPVEWSLSGPDKALFTIVGGVLRFGAPPDFDGPGDNEYHVVVEATDDDPDNMLTGTWAVTVNVTGVNEAPVVSEFAVVRYPENETYAVASYTAIDPEGDAVEWSLSGTDMALFTIVGGVLSFGATPDFEGPGDNEYDVVVVASDGELTGTAAVTVSVANVDETGEALLAPSEPQVGSGVMASVTDPDGIVGAPEWRWGRSTNRSSWSLIDGEASSVYTPGAGDVGHWLRATASYTDGHPSVKQAAAVSGAAVVPSTTNDPPVFPAPETELFVAENTPDGRDIGDPVAASDPGDRLTYTMTGPDASLFEIVPASGQLRTSGALNYEDQNSLAVMVTATDGGGASTSQRVTVTVTDIDEEPEVSGLALVRYPENETHAVADYTAYDPENQPVEWSLSGPDAAHFNIDPSSGRLSFATPPDREARRNLYEVTVQATDNTDNTGRLAVTVNVTDIDEPPIVTGDAAPSHPELSTAPVDTYRADDPEDHFVRWSLSGPDADDFSIDSSGTLRFAGPPELDLDNVYQVTVEAYDGGLTGILEVIVTIVARQPPKTTGGGGGGGGGGSAPAVVEIGGPSYAAAGSEAVFTAAVSDGAGIDALRWTAIGPDGFTATGDAPQLAFVAPSSGSYTVSVSVTVVHAGRRTLTDSVTLAVLGDITDHQFVDEIVWLAQEGITSGCADFSFCPGRPVTRAQMASFLARALDLEPPRQQAGFVDVDSSGVHSANIEALFAAQITAGCSQQPLSFCPHRPVTRAQMASFLAGALDLEPPRQQAGFVDVDSSGVHGANIEALFAAQITAGCSQQPLSFCPHRPVTRAQMAAFLYRARHLIARAGSG